MYLLAGLPGDSTISPLKEIVENCDASVFESDILKHMVSLQGTAARPLHSSTPAVDEDACDVVQGRQYHGTLFINQNLIITFANVANLQVLFKWQHNVFPVLRFVFGL